MTGTIVGEETDKENVAATGAQSIQASGAGGRIHYLDNLRALAMILGVLLHAGLAYAAPAQEVWLATDSQSSIAIDMGIWFIHLFRMGLFYLLSGYFAALLVKRKGVKKFLVNRGIRIALPMILFFPFLAGAMMLVIIAALSMEGEKRGLMGLIARTIEAGPSAGESTDQSTLGWMHLWFLYYLLIFSLLAALCTRLPTIHFNWLFKRRWLMALAPLTLAPCVALAGVPLPAAESFVPVLWPFGFYGLFYWAGWQLFGRESSLDKLRPYAWPLLLCSLLLYVPYYLYLPELSIEVAIARKTTLPAAPLFIESILTAYLSVSLTIVSLLLGQRFLSNYSGSMRFVADASYWVYLVHLPIVLLLQTLLIPLEVNVWLKFAFTTSATLVACMATYVVFVRYTPIGWMLNGKRAFP